MATTRSASDKVWDLLTRAAVPLSVIVAGAMIAHEVRISVIESNRFTNHDGDKLDQEIKYWIENRYPPEWLREEMNELKRSQREMLRRITEIERKIK